MTGIERLREVAGVINCSVWACSDSFYCEAHDLTPYNDGGMMRVVLEDIADQIEREQNEMVADSPYDAILPEDREAIAWVREHGGIAYVKDAWNARSNLGRQLETAKAKVERQQRHIEDVQGKCRERQGRIVELERQRTEAVSAQLASDAALYDLRREVLDVCRAHGIEAGDDPLRAIDKAMNRRLMPEGMEWLLEVWPKWSNGEYCKFGDWWTADKYGDYEPKQLRRLAFFTPEQLREWEQDEGDNFGYEWDFMRPSDTTYRPDKVEPPAPKVLDADGVEIRVGDTVWHIETGEQCKVVEVDSRSVSVDFRVDGDGTKHTGSILPANLTHRAPVIAADGEPLLKDETVWSVESGTRYTVEKITDELIPVKCRSEMGSTVSLHPSQLTHERPESWGHLEKDARSIARDIAWNLGNWSPSDFEDVGDDVQARVVDLVRRARALAGVSE